MTKKIVPMAGRIAMAKVLVKFNTSNEGKQELEITGRLEKRKIYHIVKRVEILRNKLKANEARKKELLEKWDLATHQKSNLLARLEKEISSMYDIEAHEINIEIQE